MSGHSAMTRFLLGAYNLAWLPALPALYCLPRLREGFARRMLRQGPEAFADIWVQAASGGEAFLARELIMGLPVDRRLTVLATTMTSQGLGILEKAAGDAAESHPLLTVNTTYFPFDAPSLMDKAVERFSPKCVVLLETEIWPGPAGRVQGIRRARAGRQRAHEHGQPGRLPLRGGAVARSPRPRTSWPWATRPRGAIPWCSGRVACAPCRT